MDSLWVKKFLQTQSTVKYVIFQRLKLEKYFKKSIVVLGNKNDTGNIYGLYSNKDFFALLNLSNFFYNRRRVFFRSFPCSNKLLKEILSKDFILLLRMHVKLLAWKSSVQEAHR